MAERRGGDRLAADGLLASGERERLTGAFGSYLYSSFCIQMRASTRRTLVRGAREVSRIDLYESSWWKAQKYSIQTRLFPMIVNALGDISR